MTCLFNGHEKNSFFHVLPLIFKRKHIYKLIYQFVGQFRKVCIWLILLIVVAAIIVASCEVEKKLWYLIMKLWFELSFVHISQKAHWYQIRLWISVDKELSANTLAQLMHNANEKVSFHYRYKNFITMRQLMHPRNT